MKAALRLAPCFLLAGAVLAACAGERLAAQQPETREAQRSPRDDGRAQLVRELETLKEPGVKAVQDTQEARSVLEAIGGATQMQGDAGLADR
jgi:hypothetical protein